MFSFKVHGDFNRTTTFLEKMKALKIQAILQRYGGLGVSALASATPKDSGNTAACWGYTVKSSQGSHSIVWTNSNINGGVPIAVILQYGHGTGTGGYVPGRDYINPAIRPVFDKIAADVWREVTSA